MTQILDSLPSDGQRAFLCCYVNATSKIQVARITNIPNWYFERVVFPGQRLLFEAIPHAQLEIHTGMMASAILSDTIPCERLALQEASDKGGMTTQGMPSSMAVVPEPIVDRTEGRAAMASVD
ncbi:MAG: DUF1830 domain-containing protein [Cyanobacteria bacterium J06635_1]